METGKRVAITGGTGFVGRHLVRECLREGWKVRVLSRNVRKARQISDEIEVFVGDLADGGTDLAGFVGERDALIHCAGEIRDESKMRGLHIDGCQRLIAAASGRVAHWLQLSSVGVYGRPKTGTVTEESAQAPAGTYEETKARADGLVLGAAKNGAFDYTILRPTSIYGTDMPNESLRSLIRMIQKGAFFFIGSPGAQAVYIHVEDVVGAMVACVKNPKARNCVYIVAGQFSIEELVRIVCEASDRMAVFRRMPLGLAKMIAAVGEKVPGFPLTRSRVAALTTRIRYDTSKISEELQFKARITPCQGLREIVLAMSSEEKA